MVKRHCLVHTRTFASTHRAWFIGALVRSRAALPSLAYSIGNRVPRSHTVIDQCIPAQKSAHHATISETTCSHTTAYTHGQGTRRAVILPLVLYCIKSHDILLAGQVICKAYEDGLEGVYRCFRASRGVTQSPWAFELDKDMEISCSQTIADHCYIEKPILISKCCYMLSTRRG
jgi:hypothetical protein